MLCAIFHGSCHNKAMSFAIQLSQSLKCNIITIINHGERFSVQSKHRTQDIRPNKKSLTIGEPANSGFKRIQLQNKALGNENALPQPDEGQAHLKKYSRPIRRDSRNFRRNLTGGIC